MTVATKESPFLSYYETLEKKITASVLEFGAKTKLRDACGYALTNGGKRFRPLIVMFIAEALGKGLDVYPAALSVEFFHTASLIADDLPCMDNDDERRDKPSLHKVYGESIALLASYALITAAFEKIHQNADLMKQEGSIFEDLSGQACLVALQSAASCAGILGATGGQFFDLFPPNQTLEMVKKVIYQKTVTLFEVAFVFGWVFGGGEMGRLDLVKQAAYHFGMAFQTADDLNDLLQDEQKEKEINIARLLGKEGAFSYFNEEMDNLQKTLKELNLFTPSFEKMFQILMGYALCS